jgi:hypothetical protein
MMLLHCLLDISRGEKKMKTLAITQVAGLKAD